QTELVIHAPDRPGGTPEVAEFLLTVQRRRIDYDMVMNMVLINMGADDKSVITFRELQRKLTHNLIGFFRRDFTGSERLPEMVGNHIVCALTPSGLVKILPLGKKKFRIRNPGIALVPINEFSKIRFLRIFHIIN